MNPFEYTSVIVSLVLGLSMATLVQGATDVFRARARVASDALTWAWALALLGTQMQLFVGAWALRGRFIWPSAIVILWLLGPLLLLGSSMLLFPRPDEDDTTTVKDDRFGDGRNSLGVLALYHVWVVLSSSVMGGGISAAHLTSGAIFVGTVILAVFVRHTLASWVLVGVYWAHIALALVHSPTLTG